MYRFLETIRLQEGYETPWEDHQQRVDRTFRHFGVGPSLQLRSILSEVVLPEGHQVYKMSVYYTLEGNTRIQLQPYRIRSIASIKLVALPPVDYTFKYADREWINDLVQQAGTDDILLHDQGYIKDASYANVAFLDGSEWVTPLHPLLAGTHRARLLRQGTIQARNIYIDELEDFQEMRWVNALMTWEEASRVDAGLLKQMIF